MDKMKSNEQYISFGDITLFVKQIFSDKRTGTNDPIVIFLHEGLGSVGQWKDFPEKVIEATGLNAMLYDRQGYGKSSPLTTKRNIDYLKHEEELFNTLIKNLQVKKYYLIGHSEGGTIALIHASRQPKGLLKVITLSANTINEPKISESINKIIDQYHQQDSHLRQSLKKYHGSNTDLIFDAWSLTWTAPFFQNLNIDNELRKIQVPVLAFHGTADKYTTLIQIEKIKQNVHSEKELVIIPGGTHHLHFDNTETVLKHLVSFIQK